jgi:hypothetical protein
MMKGKATLPEKLISSKKRFSMANWVLFAFAKGTR